MSNPNQITISWEEYVRLVNDSDEMAFLRMFDVANWEGYDMAMQALEDYYTAESLEN